MWRLNYYTIIKTVDVILHKNGKQQKKSSKRIHHYIIENKRNVKCYFDIFKTKLHTQMYDEVIQNFAQ